MRVLFFGASIAQGFWDSKGGWIQRIRSHYDLIKLKDIRKEDDYPDVINLGISGDKTTSIIKRLENEVEARKYPDEDIAIVVEIGTNDSYQKDGKYFSTPEDYEARLQEIVEITKKYTNRIMFVGLPPADESLTKPVSWHPTLFYTNERLLKYENIMARVSAKNNVPFVPIFERFLAEQQKRNLFADGLHPNDEGHEFMAQLILPEIEKLIR